MAAVTDHLPVRRWSGSGRPHPEFAKFILHTLTIAGAEMLMGFAKTGLGLCSVDPNGDSAACAGLGRRYNLSERFCCRFAAGAATVDRRCNF
jgi:hypothetical protein